MPMPNQGSLGFPSRKVFPRISCQGWDAMRGPPARVPDGGFAAFAGGRQDLQVLQVDAGRHGGAAGRVHVGASGVPSGEQAGPTGLGAVG